MKFSYVFGILSSTLLAAAVACTTPASGADDQTPTATPPPTSEPSGEMKEVAAPIDGVKIIAEEGDSGRYFAVVTSGLPSGCAEFYSYSATHEGRTINVSVTNKMPADPGTVCTDIYRTAKTKVDLGADLEEGKTYEVVVNDEVTKTFVPDNNNDDEPDEGKRKEVAAPIDEVEIIVGESDPPEYSVRVVSGLPTGCAKFEDYEVERDGNTINITVTNTMPTDDVMCTMIYRTHESIISLGSRFQEGETYRVVVNDEVTKTFVAGEVSDPGDDNGNEPGEGERKEVAAPIDEVDIRVAESAPPQYFVYVVSGLPSGCAKFEDYEVERDGNIINITVTNTMPTGDVACTMIYGTHESNISLGSDFEPGETYIVKVNGEVETFVAGGTPAEASLDQEFPIRAGESVSIPSEDLTIEFIEVVEDSRCPADVQCIWAGQARVLVSVTKDGEDLGEHELILTPGDDDSAVKGIDGYQVRLVALQPDPGVVGSKVNIEASDYIATLEVEKASEAAQ